MPIINDSLSSSANATSSVLLGLAVIGCGCGIAAGSVFTGWTVALASSANATSSAVPTGWAGCLGGANATSSVALGVTTKLSSAAAGSSLLRVDIPTTATGTANGTSAISLIYADWTLASSANGTSALSYAYTTNLALAAAGVGTSRVVYGGIEICSGTADATAAIALNRFISVLCAASANATGSVNESATIPDVLLAGSAAGSASVALFYTSNVTGSSSAQGESSVYYNDPALKAWVMNTETGAPFWYDNYNFESMTQLPDGRILAASAGGVFTITRGDDAGSPINYRLITGFMDFGQPTIKRMDAMYMSETNAAGISIWPEVQETGPAVTAKMIEPHSSSMPRNSRVLFPKGLWGRHWRFTISGAAEFQINDMTMDVAFSNRRL